VVSLQQLSLENIPSFLQMDNHPELAK